MLEKVVKMYRLRLLLSAILLLVATFRSPPLRTHSQASQFTPSPIYVGEQILWNQTQWSPDSTTLFFTGIDNGLHYLQFQIGDSDAAELEQPPLTINLTPQQQVQFRAASPQAFVSFDQDYIIYESQYQIQGSEGWKENVLALGNLSTGEYAFIEKGGASSYSIIWNETSSAVLIVDVGHYGGLGGVWYIANFRKSVSDLSTTLLINYVAGSHGYVDISADGQYVLTPEHWDDMETGLRLWDATVEIPPQQFAAASSPILLADQVTHGATFVPDREDELLIVIQEGIIRFNVKTLDTELVNADINASWVDWAYFSPDNQYVAILSQPERKHRGWSCQMYVLPVDFRGNVWEARNDYPCRFYG